MVEKTLKLSLSSDVRKAGEEDDVILQKGCEDSTKAVTYSRKLNSQCQNDSTCESNEKFHHNSGKCFIHNIFPNLVTFISYYLLCLLITITRQIL